MLKAWWKARGCQMKRIIMSTSIFLLFTCLCSSPAPVLPASIVRIGNPGLEQFPKNDTGDCFARTIWDMHYYNGSIYVGMGDYWHSVGPIGVWAFDADDSLRKDYTIDEQQVWGFREYDGKLFIPGIDSTEPWDYGNIYINDGHTWQKLRTIPDGVHVIDAAVSEGKIYVIRTSAEDTAVLESYDMGQSWQLLMTAGELFSHFKQMVALDDSLIIMGNTTDDNTCIYRYRNNNLETLVFSLFPGTSYRAPVRSVRFRDGILYTGRYTVHPVGSLLFISPLFFLSPSSETVTTKGVWEKSIRDIIVRDDICYVLTASEMDDAFQGTIHSSSNLDNWTEIVTFTVTALPYSFELLDGVFYVGLGFSKPRDGQAVAESGSIYRINLDESPPAWDVNKDGTIDISDLALLGQYLGKDITTSSDSNPDVNGDGEVDILDLVLVGTHFGETYFPTANSN